MPIGRDFPKWEPKADSLRPDGTKKGKGWMGVLKRPDGRVSTEISAGVNIDGKETLIPLIVPGLAPEELNWLLNTDESSPDFFKKMPPSIMDKAVDHAIRRLKQGASPFKD